MSTIRMFSICNLHVISTEALHLDLRSAVRAVRVLRGEECLQRKPESPGTQSTPEGTPLSHSQAQSKEDVLKVLIKSLGKLVTFQT